MIPKTAGPSRQVRIGIALAVGVLSAAVVLRWAFLHPLSRSDIDQVLFAARTLLDGRDPYPLIGPGRAFDSPWPLVYPLPAALVAMPLAGLPVVWARAAFVGLTSAALAYGLTRDGYTRLLLLCSASYFVTVTAAQWSSLLTAMAFLPALTALALVKPNLGAAMVVAAPARSWRWAVGGAVVLLGASFAVLPGWVAEWAEAVRSTHHFAAPVARPGGPLLLLALLRWRRPEARLFLALSCVPQTPSTYDLLPVLLVAERRLEVVALAVLSYVPNHVVVFVLQLPSQPLPAYNVWVDALGHVALWSVYVPALLIVLRRPNEGAVPAWLERALARAQVPAVFRGRSVGTPVEPAA